MLGQVGTIRFCITRALKNPIISCGIWTPNSPAPSQIRRIRGSRGTSRNSSGPSLPSRLGMPSRPAQWWAVLYGEAASLVHKGCPHLLEENRRQGIILVLWQRSRNVTGKLWVFGKSVLSLCLESKIESVSQLKHGTTATATGYRHLGYVFQDPFICITWFKCPPIFVATCNTYVMPLCHLNGSWL